MKNLESFYDIKMSETENTIIYEQNKESSGCDQNAVPFSPKQLIYEV